MSSAIFAITTIYGDGLDLLTHWLEHYSGLGADAILLAVGFTHEQDFLRGKSYKDNILPTVIEVAKHYPAQVYPFCFDEYHTMYTQHVRERVKEHAGVKKDDWVMHADLDEFYEFPVPLRELTKIMEEANDWALHGHILDRVAEDGTLKPVVPHINIGEQFPIGCHLTGRVFGANTRKIMLCRGRVRVNAAHDNTFNARFQRCPIGDQSQYIAHHFRWTDALIPRLRSRLLGNGIGKPYRAEIERFFAYWKKHGKINLTDPRIAARYYGPLKYHEGGDSND